MVSLIGSIRKLLPVLMLVFGLQGCAKHLGAVEEKMVKTDEQVVEMVELILQDAKSKISSDEWKEANDVLKTGLDLMGNRYSMRGLEDDTGTSLIFSDIAEEKGQLNISAKGRNTILNSRLNALKEKLEKQKVAEQGK